MKNIQLASLFAVTFCAAACGGNIKNDSAPKDSSIPDKSSSTTGAIYLPATDIVCRGKLDQDENTYGVPDHLKGGFTALIELRPLSTSSRGDVIDANIVLYSGGSYLTEGPTKIRFGVSTKVNSEEEVRQFYDLVSLTAALPIPGEASSQASTIGKLSYFSIETGAGADKTSGTGYFKAEGPGNDAASEFRAFYSVACKLSR